MHSSAAGRPPVPHACWAGPPLPRAPRAPRQVRMLPVPVGRRAGRPSLIKWALQKKSGILGGGRSCAPRCSLPGTGAHARPVHRERALPHSLSAFRLASFWIRTSFAHFGGIS